MSPSSESRPVFELLYRLAHSVGRLRRAVRARLGIARRLTIVPYRGHGTPERACVSFRVQEDRGAEHVSDSRLGTLAAARASYRRYATVEIPGARVRIRWDGLDVERTADDGGFVEAWLAPDVAPAPGVATASVEVLAPRDEPPVRAEVPIQVTPPTARLGVISDVDDTVIETGVPNLMRRWIALFLTDARVRLPFDGVGAFYGALRDGPTGQEGNPVFYVSSSPWNLHRHLEALLARHDIPAGPLLLRDWGLSRTGFAPGGGHGHKLEKIESILVAYPDLPFVLVGDSGQEDPEHYAEIVRRHPDRILAIYIRAVTSSARRTREIARLAERTAADGVDLLMVPDTVTAARHAAANGWVAEAAVARTRRRAEIDRQAPDAIEELLADDSNDG